jgi:hypothetical protein
MEALPPLCGRDYYTVSQNMETGAWHCYGCGSSGSTDVGLSGDSLLARLRPVLGDIKWPEMALPEWHHWARTALKYLRERGIADPARFGIVEVVDSTRILIPYFGPDGDIIYYVTRWFVDDGRPKYVGAPGSKPPFVLPDWRSYDEEVAFMEGPVDAIVYHIATGNPVIALGGTSLPDYLVHVIDDLARGGRRVVLDHDALSKGLQLVQDLGADIQRLPVGEDPASYYGRQL